jgi:GT2 family glycosyltransferase
MGEIDRRTEVAISLIIVNWNGKHFLEDCLRSVWEQSFTDFEVIVVDNGSSDGSVEWIRDACADRVTLIENKANLGFAEGNNQAIRVSRGAYMVLVNNDTVLHKDFLLELSAAVEGRPDVGMCASKILVYDDPQRIDAVGMLLYPDGLNRQQGHLERDEGQYERDGEILFPAGCGSLYRKSMLDEIGLFDEAFFAYGEDTDLGLRGRLAGWKCVYAHRAVIYHKGSGSTAKYSPFKAFHVERNRLWVAVKNFPFWLLLLNPFFTAYRFFFQAMGVVTGKGAAGRFRTEHSALGLLGILFKAYGSALRGMGTMMKKRRAVRRLRRVSNREIMGWFRAWGINARDIAFME